MWPTLHERNPDVIGYFCRDTLAVLNIPKYRRREKHQGGKLGMQDSHTYSLAFYVSYEWSTSCYMQVTERIVLRTEASLPRSICSVLSTLSIL